MDVKEQQLLCWICEINGCAIHFTSLLLKLQCNRKCRSRQRSRDAWETLAVLDYVGFVSCFAGVTAEMQNLVQRRIYPFLLMVVVLMGILSFQVRQFKRLYEHIKNDKWVYSVIGGCVNFYTLNCDNNFRLNEGVVDT